MIYTFNLLIISVEPIKYAQLGMTINDVVFKPQPLTVIFRIELRPFEQNSWFICLQADQLQGCPQFFQLYEYARKMNDALSKKYRVLFKTYNLTLQDFNILTDEIIEHETIYRGSDIHPNPYDYDPSGL